MEVPFFRPSITEAEIDEVVACLRSGWLTTGPRTKQFEAALAEFVGAERAVAANSCTSALHLAVEALRLGPGQGVLVPTMTFAATAEVVRYQGAVPILVDCDPVTLNVDLDDAQRKIDQLRQGLLPLERQLPVVGIIPVHVGGLMVDMDALKSFADRHHLWVVEDAAHALPAAFRQDRQQPWQRAGENTADVTCFSFYANKTITTGEGGMAVTADRKLADRMRQMSLHGLSHDAWRRYVSSSAAGSEGRSAAGSEGRCAWDYQIVAPGFKYNMTDVAAAIGIQQLKRAEQMRRQRETIAQGYREALGDLPQLELPAALTDRVHAWHLFPVRLRLERLSIDRNALIEQLHNCGVGCSVHWRPLHLHRYYAETFAWRPEHLPVATAEWERLVSLPLFPDMRDEELDHVTGVLHDLCSRHAV